MKFVDKVCYDTGTVLAEKALEVFTSSVSCSRSPQLFQGVILVFKLFSRLVLLAVFSLTVLIDFTAARADDFKTWADAHVDELVTLYKDFHSHPELSFLEEQTAAKLAKELKAIGAELHTGVGGHGVVAVLKNGAGPTVMIRTDLDALPVIEATELPFASKVKFTRESGEQVGVMHACGHDIHITNLIGVARCMAAHKDQWRGTLVMIGQPAEEKGAGAKAMLDDGLFKRFPRPDFALALHVDSFLETGKVGFRAGYALANVDSCDISVRGRGGHGSYPHGTIDPIVQAAYLIVDLQTIISREIAPLEPAVITVGSIHGGTKHNIIGDSCHLQLTIRSYSADVRRHLKEAIIRKAKAVAQSFRAPEPLVKYAEGTPSLFNNERLVDRIVPVFRKTLGESNVIESDRSMGGEDFSRYGRAGIPVFMFRLGSIDPERMAQAKKSSRRLPSLHSPLYYPEPKETLRTGVTSMTHALLELFEKP